MSAEEIQSIQDRLREALSLITVESIRALPTFRAFEPTSNKLQSVLHDVYASTGDERAKQLANLIFCWGEYWFNDAKFLPDASISVIHQFIQNLENKKSQETV